MKSVESLIMPICKGVIIGILLRGVVIEFVHSQHPLLVFAFYAAFVILVLSGISLFKSESGIISKFKQ